MSKAPPSKKKLERARKDGKILKSQLVTRTLSFLGVVFGVNSIIPIIFVNNRILLQYIVIKGASDPEQCLSIAGNYFLIITSACLMLGATIAIFAEWLQVGLCINCVNLAPKYDRIDPTKGVKRWCAGIKQFWLLAVKLLVLVGVATWSLSIEVPLFASLAVIGSGESVPQVLGRAFLHVMLWSAGALTFLASIDYMVNRHKFVRELEMSPEEVRRENREEEGNPLVKSCRRAEHRALTMQALVQKIRRSKVVVVERIQQGSCVS